MELTSEEDELLAAGLVAVGDSVKRGAGVGAGLAARAMRADLFETPVELAVSLAVARELVGLTLVAMGARICETQALVGLGTLNMNPAAVTVTIRGQGGKVVRGVAKEGVVPQRAGRKAARRVAEHLAGGPAGNRTRNA
jgi:putative Mn2+ efflux pump MntP